MAAQITPEVFHDILEHWRGLLFSRRAHSAAALASNEAIEALKDVAGERCGGDQLECVICLEQAEANSKAAGWKQMPCEHRFHGSCLEKWLRVHGTCPMCRHQLTPPVPDDELVARQERRVAALHLVVVLETNIMAAMTGFDVDEDYMEFQYNLGVALLNYLVR